MRAGFRVFTHFDKIFCRRQDLINVSENQDMCSVLNFISSVELSLVSSFAHNGEKSFLVQHFFFISFGKQNWYCGMQ